MHPAQDDLPAVPLLSAPAAAGAKKRAMLPCSQLSAAGVKSPTCGNAHYGQVVAA